MNKALEARAEQLRIEGEIKRGTMLQLIRDGHAFTVRDIINEMEVSQYTAETHLLILVRQGDLERMGKKGSFNYRFIQDSGALIGKHEGYKKYPQVNLGSSLLNKWMGYASDIRSLSPVES